MAPTWEASSSYTNGLVSAMTSLGVLARARAAVGPLTLSMLEAPQARSWWPGEVLTELFVALGPKSAREVSVWTSRDTMGPLVKPLVGVLLALTRSPPQALFERLPTFVAAGVRGIDTRFSLNADGRGGLAIFAFPGPVPADVAAMWAGLFEVGFSLARGGRLVGETIAPTEHRFDVAW